MSHTATQTDNWNDVRAAAEATLAAVRKAMGMVYDA